MPENPEVHPSADEPRYGIRVPGGDPVADPPAAPSLPSYAAQLPETSAALNGAAEGAAAFSAPAPGVAIPGAPAVAAARPVIAPAPTADNIVRGLLLALVVIPVGVIVWVLLWQAGFIASIVSFGVAYGATYLYRLGSGGTRIVTSAVWGIVAIVVVTLVLSLLGGIAYELVHEAGAGWAVLTEPGFWDVFGRVIVDPHVWSQLGTTVALAVVFTALGCFRTILRLVRESKIAAHLEAQQTQTQSGPQV